MNDLTPTRSLLIALGDERRTMREGYAFLDEKCLLLAEPTPGSFCYPAA